MSRRYFNRMLLCVTLVLFVFFVYRIACAGEVSQSATGIIDWFHLAATMAAGLSLFLFGIALMSKGLKNLAGDRMRSVLVALTKHRIAALLVGVIITIAINSSSATTSMLVGFVQAGLLSFVETLGVILGADIGTTVTVQLIAFKINIYIIYLVTAFGFFLWTFGGDKIKSVGRAVMGFGLLFWGMILMEEAMKPLRTCPGFINAMKGLDNRFLGVLIGTAVTALIQSSAATIGIVMPLCVSGLVSIETGIAIMMGANIGTCITAGIASLQKTREAKRVVVAHVLFKVAGVAIFVWLIPYLAGLVEYLAGFFGSDAGRQIANAHTIFNVLMAMVFLPFILFFARVVYKIMPRRRPGGIEVDVWELDEDLIAAPQFAFVLVRKKLAGMAKLLEQMLRAIIIPFISDEEFIRRENLSAGEIDLLVKIVPKQDEIYPELSLQEGVDLREKTIDAMEEGSKKYLLKLLSQELSSEQAREARSMILVANEIEKVADIAHRNLPPLAAKKRKLNHDFSLEGKEELMVFHHKVCKQIRRLERIFSSLDFDQVRTTAREITMKINEHKKLKMEYFDQHLRRVLTNREESAETDEVHLELINTLNDINKHVGDIVRIILDTWPATVKEKKGRKKEGSDDK